jgi:voltage-gated potassium channel
MSHSEPPEELGPFQFAVLLLSLALLLALVVEWVVPMPHEIQRLVVMIDTAVCGVLFVDFAVRFKSAKSKLQFLKWGWIDLIASIPAIDVFRYGRVLRIVRVIRLLVAIRSFKRLLHILWASKTSAGLSSILVIAFLVISFGSAGVLFAELGATHANIRTAEDALWWSMSTVTTVGYGDTYPVTTAGRLVASTLMISGIGLFGTLGGIAAGIFIGHDKHTQATGEAQQAILDRLESLQKEITALRQDRRP